MNIMKNFSLWMNWKFRGHKAVAQLFTTKLMQDDYLCDYIIAIEEITRRYTGSKVIAETMATVAGILYVISSICPDETSRAGAVQLLLKGSTLAKAIKEIANSTKDKLPSKLVLNESFEEPEHTFM